MKDFRVEGTTINHFDYLQNYFTVDLHGCESVVARRVIKSRLRECYHFGIEFLEVIHGHPKSEFSLVDVLRDVLEDPDAREVLIGCIALDEKGCMSDANHTATRLLLKKNPEPDPQDSRMSFSGFRVKYHFDEVDPEDVPKYVPFIAEGPEYGYSFNLLARTIFNYGIAVPNGVSSQHSSVLKSALDTLSSDIPSSEEASQDGFNVICFQVSRSVFKNIVSMVRQRLSMQEEAARLIGCPEEFCLYASTLVADGVPLLTPMNVFYFNVRDEVGEPRAVGFTKDGLVDLRNLWKKLHGRGLQYPRLAKQRFKSEPFILDGERLFFTSTKKDEFGLTLEEQKIADGFTDPYSPYKIE